MSFEELKNYYMSDENKEILKSEYLNSTPLSKGAEKIVSINGPKVFLKYYDLDPASSIAVEQFKNSFSSQLESNYQMLKNGINVVPIFGYFKHDGCYVEVQEKAPGDVLHLINTSSAAIKFLNSEEFPLQHEEIYKKIVKDKQKEYNLQMQQKLLDAPQSFFDKLLADARLLAVKHEQPLNDLNAENIMFDQEKGFFFIDLEPYTFVHEEKPKRPTDFTIFKKVTWMLASMDNFYTNCEDDSVYMPHKKANKILMSKLLNAVLNDYFIFSLEDFSELENIIKRHCASNDSEEIINTFKAQYFAKIKIF